MTEYPREQEIVRIRCANAGASGPKDEEMSHQYEHGLGMGDGRVVEEKTVPCFNGGATLCGTVERLGTTTVGVTGVTVSVGFEYVILGKIRSGGILSPK